AAEGFEQIIDFLRGSYIHYALTMNPHIYISCIKQFWNTASVKHSADVTRLQALVDKKKIVLSENVIRQILQLDDAEGVDVTYDAILSPPSLDIPSPPQEQSSPPHQPQSSPQAPPQGEQFPTHIQQILDVCSALTRCVKNLENDKATQKLEIIKLKARVKRLEKANKVKSSKLRRLRKVGASTRVESSDDMEDAFNQGRMIDDLDKDEGIDLAEINHLDLDHPSKVLSMQEDDSKVQEVVEVVTTANLITDVVTAASQVSVASATISTAKLSIPAAAPIVVAAYTRRRKGVIIRDPEEELSSKTPVETPKLKDKGKGILIETSKPMKKKDQIELDVEYAKKLHEEINKDHEEINKDIDWDAAMDHVNRKSKNPQYIKRYQGMKKRPQTESEARKNMMIYLKNTAGYMMDFFKGMSYAKICPIFQARFLFKSREEIEEEDQEVIKSINESPAQKVAKRRKLSEEVQEAEDLRKRLEVVDDEDDDVFIEATPLARKTMFLKPDEQDAVWKSQRSVHGLALMDVKTAFLNEKLTEDVFMAQPKGFENAKYPKRVCKLQKAIYRLKQASRSWNLCFHEKVIQFGFSRSEDESCIYVKVSRSVVVFLVLYVDDILCNTHKLGRSGIMSENVTS
nr:reverse transcriptase [Tanacetum cinerariifolium]